MSSRALGLAYLVTAVLLWSTAEVATRLVVDAITPIQLAAVRFSAGGVFLALFLPFELRRRRLRTTRRILLHSMWLAWIGVVGANLCYQYSLQHAGAGVVAAVFGTNPLMVFVFARLVLGEPMTLARFSGVVLGLLGLVVLSMSEASDAFSLVGVAFALCCSACFGLFTVLVKRLAGPFGGLPIMTYAALFGALYFLPMVWAEGERSTLEHVGSIWLPVLYLSIGATGISYLLYFIGLQRVEATQAASTMFLKPPLAAALAYMVLGEPITWNLAAAIVLILAGLYMVIMVNRRQLSSGSGC